MKAKKQHVLPQGDGKLAEPTAERTHFTTKRAMEFFSEKELTTQLGHAPAFWAVAILGEMIDNGLDACETAGTSPPVIRIIIDPNAVTIADNGPGLPTNVLTESLNYDIRISDKTHRVIPSRGQQGLGLKGAWAAPVVVNGRTGRAEVVAGGERHTIEITLNQIDQAPVIHHSRAKAAAKVGTQLKLHWPEIASFLEGGKGHDFYNVDHLLAAYETFNPHAKFVLGRGVGAVYGPIDVGWNKWKPDRLTDANWYSLERMVNLIAAHIANERSGAKPLTVREFVKSFHGLSGTATQQRVVAAAGLSRAMLHDLVKGDDVDPDAIRKLLSAMQEATTWPVQPKALGVLGKDHLTRCLGTEWGCAPGSIRYKAAMGMVGKVPYVLELALGVHKSRGERNCELIAGVNWSPKLENPFRSLMLLDMDARIDDEDPVTVLAHLAYPQPAFSDRGKGRVNLPAQIDRAVKQCLESVAKAWAAEKKKADRDGRLQQAQLDRLRKAEQTKSLSLVDATNLVIEGAYLQASGEKDDPANARQIMYVARPRVLELTGGACWKNDSYFTQKLLPDFIEAHPALTADWDVVYDARGHLIEPHTERMIDLGTREVREYLEGFQAELPDRPGRISVPTVCPTFGPAHRYRFVLFLEKEGFYNLLERRQIRNRFDIGIMSTKGMSVTAARQLVDRLSEQGTKILVMRDFDVSGFSIVHTIQTDSRRYTFRSTPNVIDIGLRLTDVRQWGLEAFAEPVAFSKKLKKDPRIRLRAAGATAEECAFLVHECKPGQSWAGRRVEMNAFTSPRFIEFLEHKFDEAGVTKVVPSGANLAAAYRLAWANAELQHVIDAAAIRIGQSPAPSLPGGLASRIAASIAGTAKSWDAALAAFVQEQRAQRASRRES